MLCHGARCLHLRNRRAWASLEPVVQSLGNIMRALVANPRIEDGRLRLTTIALGGHDLLHLLQFIPCLRTYTYTSCRIYLAFQTDKSIC